MCNLKPSDSNDAKTFSSDSIYVKVRLVLACFLGGQRNIKFVAEVKLNWNSTERSPQNQIGLPDQLYSELNLRQPNDP